MGRSPQSVHTYVRDIVIDVQLTCGHCQQPFVCAPVTKRPRYCGKRCAAYAKAARYHERKRRALLVRETE